MFNVYFFDLNTRLASYKLQIDIRIYANIPVVFLFTIWRTYNFHSLLWSNNQYAAIIFISQLYKYNLDTILILIQIYAFIKYYRFKKPYPKRSNKFNINFYSHNSTKI